MEEDEEPQEHLLFEYVSPLLVTHRTEVKVETGEEGSEYAVASDGAGGGAADGTTGSAPPPAPPPPLPPPPSLGASENWQSKGREQDGVGHDHSDYRHIQQSTPKRGHAHPAAAQVRLGHDPTLNRRSSARRGSPVKASPFDGMHGDDELQAALDAGFGNALDGAFSAEDFGSDFPDFAQPLEYSRAQPKQLEPAEPKQLDLGEGRSPTRRQPRRAVRRDPTPPPPPPPSPKVQQRGQRQQQQQQQRQQQQRLQGTRATALVDGEGESNDGEGESNDADDDDGGGDDEDDGDGDDDDNVGDDEQVGDSAVASLRSPPVSLTSDATAAATTTSSDDLGNRRRRKRSEPRLEREKPNACAMCHRMREKCVFPPSSRKCTRCTKLNKRCVPRIVIRSRGSGQTASRAAAATTGLRPNQARAYSMTRLLAEDVTVGAHLLALGDVVQLLDNLNVDASPTFLEVYVRNQLLIAVRQNSHTRLHSAACMSLGFKIELDLSWLVELPEPLPSDRVEDYSQLLHSLCIMPVHSSSDGVDASLFVRVYLGKRELYASPTFEELFTPSSTILESMAAGGNPFIDVWPPFIADQTEARRCLANFFLGVFAPAEHFDGTDLHYVTFDSPRPLRVEARTGSALLGRLRLAVVGTRDGRFMHSGVAFRGLVQVERASGLETHSQADASDPDAMSVATPGSNSGAGTNEAEGCLGEGRKQTPE